jgi:hypothetical protein
MDEVMAYVKNDPQPAFSIPYTVDGDGRDLDSTPPREPGNGAELPQAAVGISSPLLQRKARETDLMCARGKQSDSCL